jgi:hypothetical protein
MSSFLFDTKGLSQDTIDSFQATYDELRSHFNMQLTGHINFHLEDFDAFNQYHDYNLLGSYVIKTAVATAMYCLWIPTPKRPMKA